MLCYELTVKLLLKIIRLREALGTKVRGPYDSGLWAGKMWEKFVDAKNGRCFVMDTVRDVLWGMEEMEQAYQSLFRRVRRLKWRMQRQAPACWFDAAPFPYIFLFFFVPLHVLWWRCRLSFCNGFRGPIVPIFKLMKFSFFQFRFPLSFFHFFALLFSHF